MNTPTEKTCRKCKQVKVLAEFHKNRQYGDGHNTYCKVCRLAERQAWAQNRSPEAKAHALLLHKEQQRKRRNNPIHALSILESHRKYRAQNREKINRDARAYTKKHYAKNGEVLRARRQEWGVRNQAYLSQYRHSVRVKRYGLTWEHYQNMLDAQQDRCAACGGLFTYENAHRTPHIDHCHTTGKVRGILCGFCNTAFGLLREKTAGVAALMRYAQAGKT